VEFTPGDIEGVIKEELTRYEDKRGWLIEVFRQDELLEDLYPLMGYISLTHPGVTRGPHEHRFQWDHFVFLGSSTFRLFLWDNRPSSPTYRNQLILTAEEGHPLRVVIPPGIVHAYQNRGEKPGLVLNFPNQLYRGWGKKEEVDEIRWEERKDSPFVVE